MNCIFSRRYLPLMLVIVCSFVGVVDGSVMLVGRNSVISFEFDGDEAVFGPVITETHGMLHVARPLDACKPLRNYLVNTTRTNVALIIRGGCSFHKKIRGAQAAGFDLAIVYNNKYNNRLLSMDGDGRGIKIGAIFISRESGETVAEYAGYTGTEVTITPDADGEDELTSMDVTRGVLSVVLAVIVVLLCISSIMCLRYAWRPIEQPTYVHSRARMARNLVKVLPCIEYVENGTDTTCVICLEDYVTGEKLRLLPCNHKFHIKCIDSWLIRRRSFCPICKHDARIKRQNPPASASAPAISPPLPFIVVTPANTSFTCFIPCSSHFSFTNGSSSCRTSQGGPSSNHGSLDPTPPVSRG